MTEEMFVALLAIIDAKIAKAGPQNGSDEGLIDSIRERELIVEFEQRFIIKDEEV